MTSKYRIAFIFVGCALAAWGIVAFLDLHQYGSAVGFVFGTLACCLADLTSRDISL